MSYFLEHPELFDQVLRLGKEEREEPMKVIEDFFNGYRLYECRELLWNMMECCLTTDNTAFAEAEERDGLLQYFKELEGMMEAAWLVGRGKGYLKSLNAPAASKAPISGPATGIHA